MNKKNIYDKNKSDVLPWVTDWSDPQDHIRFSKNVRGLSYWDWYWCHPSAYKLFFYGIPSGLLFVLLLFDFLFYFFWDLKGFVLLSLLFVVPMFFLLVKRVREYGGVKFVTFYDLHMREYPKNNQVPETQQDKKDEVVKNGSF